ncbi:MAG: MFS transporter [Candidatus Polarisedimenticolia bacterium]
MLAALYVSQAIPLGFFIVALPAILRREGLGLEQLGLLGALALPWLLKFLWAPLVDGFGLARFGHYRSWIVPLQTVSALSVLATAFFSPAGGLAPLVFAGAVFMLCSATQDVATDGLAVRNIEAAERGPANGIQVGGYYLGQILGGGVVLVLFDRLGWAPAMAAMSVLLFLPLIPLLRFRESPAPGKADGGRRRVDFAAMGRFLARPGAFTWIAILLLYRSGEAMALTMLNPMLVDRGLSLESIGLTLGLTGSLGALGGALAGGILVHRVGRKRSLFLFGGLQAGALCAYLLPAFGFVSSPVLCSVAATVSFAGGLATASLYTNMMDRSDRRTAATDFTLQQSLCAVGPLVGSILSGFSAASLGYPLHFVLCALVALASAVIVAWRLTARDAAPRLDAAVAGTA